MQFSKNFPLPKNGGHFEFSNFCQKWQNTNLLLSPQPCEIERFCRNFRPQGIQAMYSWQLSKIFLFPHMAAILNLRIFPQNGKTQIASISLTVQDKAISSKFSTHRVSKKCTLGNFQKIFPSPHMVAILNFRIFAKNGKTQIGLNHAK